MSAPKRGGPGGAQGVRVVLPDHPPALDAEAAAALLELVLEAAARRRDIAEADREVDVCNRA